MSSAIFERFCRIASKIPCVGLDVSDCSDYFCDPIGIRTFANLGVDGVHFGFIDGFDEMVFAVSPEGLTGKEVNPLAYTFEDFLGLVLACGNSSPVEQIYWMTKDQFDDLLNEDMKYVNETQKTSLSFIQFELGVEPIDKPYNYVREVQTSFDYSQIKFPDEYYELTGIDKPNK